MPHQAPHHALRSLTQTLSDAVYQAVPVGLCLVNTRGEIVSLNAEATRLLGWAEADCLGRPLHEAIECRLVYSDDQPAGQEEDGMQPRPLSDGPNASCPVAQVLDTGLPVWAPQGTIRARNGRWVPVEYQCIPLFGQETTGALFSFRDRSLQLQMEQDLQRLASIPEESPFPIIEMDEEGHLLYANREMLRLLERFGYTDRGFPAILPDNLTDLTSACLTGQPCVEPVEVMIEDLCYAWAFCAIPACRRLRAYGTNLTEIRRTERAMRSLTDIVVNKNVELDLALAKAEEAAQIKARFLATMSHEIRTPLNGVIGMLELLQDSPLSAEQTDFAATAKRSAEVLLEIINDILDFSKIEAGKLALETVECDLPALVEDVVGLLAEQASRKGVDVAGLVAPGVPTAVQGDPKRLRQVLTNLVGNAVKFTARGEVVVRVDIEDREASFVSREALPSEPRDTLHEQRETRLRFSVTDTGIGIPTARQAHLFQPFAQADSSTTRKFGGTGLGLAISKQLAELMGGTIGLESEPGRGSTFWFTVTLRVRPTQPQPAPTPPPHTRVLIVSGSDTMRLLLRQHLAAWGFTDICEDDGPRAMMLLWDAVARERPFTLAILDHNLRGPCEASAIIADPALTATSVLLLTPAAQAANLAPEAGSRIAYLGKPITRSALQRQTALLLEGAPWVSAETGTRRVDAPPATSDSRLLVVEDNEVNQTVAVRLLQKLGYQADVAANGREALAALARTPYVGILMDCQMPEMDGYEATRLIREREAQARGAGCGTRDESTSNPEPQTPNRESGAPPIPIIGMTANNLPGDRERCLAAGMDDYLAKPVTKDTLRSVLARWVSADAAAQHVRHGKQGAYTSTASPPSHPGTARESVFNISEALANLDGDIALLRQMARLFLLHYPQVIDELQKTMATHDYEKIAKIAHRVKGMVGSFCAGRASGQATELEYRGQHRDQETAVQACLGLADELLALAQALTAFLQETAPCKS